MLNANWYLVCDTQTRQASDLIQIPTVWGTATGLAEQSDEDLENFYLWSPYTTTSFVTIDRAHELDYDAASIAQVVTNCRPAVLAWVRSMRDLLLYASDVVTVPDRWMSLDVVAQDYIAHYRQALRDMTVGDLLHLTWPLIPPELDFLRTIDYSAVNRPSPGFVATLAIPFPAPTLDEQRKNQWLRIKAERDTRKAGGVRVNVEGTDYWFWTDDPSRNQYALLDASARYNNLPDEYVFDDWKTMSGQFVPLTVTLLRRMLDLGIINEGKIFNVAETHRNAVMASLTPETYNYHTGWPLSYKEYAQQQIENGNLDYSKGSEV